MKKRETVHTLPDIYAEMKSIIICHKKIHTDTLHLFARIKW